MSAIFGILIFCTVKIFQELPADDIIPRWTIDLNKNGKSFADITFCTIYYDM